MHAHPQTKRPTAASTAGFGSESAHAGVCKATSPLPPAPASPEQVQEHPGDVRKFGGLRFPQQVAGVVCADCKPGSREVSWHLWK